MSLASTSPVLRADGLSIEFPVYRGAVRALDGVSFEVMPGEIVGVVGESGCGKSVTAMLSMGLLPRGSYRVRSGALSVLGVDALHAPESSLRQLRGGRVSMVFQEPLTALNPTVRIGTQMARVIRRHRSVDAQGAQEVAVRLLQDMRVADAREVLGRYPFELSGGMRQRVLVALAFAAEPELIIADEPTTALDVTVQKQVLCLMRDRARQSNTAVLLITHDMGVVSLYTDRVVVMYAGRVIEQGPTAQVLQAPAHPYTRALLQALPEHGQPKQALPAIAGSVPDLREPPAGCGFASRCDQRIGQCAERPPMRMPVRGRLAACWHLPAEGA